MLYFNFQAFPRSLRAFPVIAASMWLIAHPVAAQTVPTADNQGVITAARLSDVFADVAKRVEPAVVSIDTKGRTPEVTTGSGDASPGQSEDIMEFFRRQMPQRAQNSVGSGFIVNSSGHIVTNAHVVTDAAKITVRLDSGDEYPARVLGSDTETDIAILKIDAGRELPFVKFADSDRARVGEWVLAIGSPFGLSRTVTAGIISQTHRETPTSTPFQKFIQTDAAINRGNSGGPLVNIDGEVVGVNSQIATSTGDYNGVGFALPSNETKYVFDQIVANGKVRRGYLGVLLDTVKPEFAKVYGMGDTRGAIVTNIREFTGPAAKAGVKAGDIIVSFDGKRVESAKDLIAKVASTPPDRSVAVDMLREEGSTLSRLSVTMSLGERPSMEGSFPPDESRQKLSVEEIKEAAKPFGLTLSELTPQLASTYKLSGEKGLIVKEISSDSFIADVKSSTGEDALSTGDVIQRINRSPVTDERSFTRSVNALKKGDPVVLHVAAFDPRLRKSFMKIVQFTVQ